MTERNVTHATFTIERTYDASPEYVFKAWSDPAIKARWFKGPEDWSQDHYSLDFRVGGRESDAGTQPGGPTHRYNALFWDIVPNARIVTTYEMHLDDVRISVSLGTLELKPEGNGTRLIYTEQGAYLDGYDDAGAREHGTGELLDALGEELRRSAATA